MKGLKPALCAMRDALDEVTHSVHWNMATPVRNVQGLPDSSMWGMRNRECALAGSSTLANWTASTNGKFSVQSAGCGVCHIGALPHLPCRGCRLRMHKKILLTALYAMPKIMIGVSGQLLLKTAREPIGERIRL